MATQAHGWAVPGPMVSSARVGAFVLGGGQGWLTRKHGSAAANLLSANVITGNGRRLECSNEENRALFRCVREGRLNSGIVTALKFALRAVGPELVAGMVLHPLCQAQKLAGFFGELTASAPDDLSSLFWLGPAPATPEVPRDLVGKPVAGIAVCLCGSQKRRSRAVGALKGFGSPLVNTITVKKFVEHQQLFDSLYKPDLAYYWRIAGLSDIGGAVRETLVQSIAQSPSFDSAIFVLHTARTVPSSNPVASTGANFAVTVHSAWERSEASESHIVWTEDVIRALRPFDVGPR